MRKPTSQALVLTVSALSLAVAVPGAAEQSGIPATKPKICVVRPDVQFGQGVNASTDPAEPVTASLISYLSGPAADVVALKSRIALQIQAEAAQQGCSHIVDTAVTHRDASKTMKRLLSAAPGLASAIPFVGGAAGGFAATAVMSAAAESMAAVQMDADEQEWLGQMKDMAQVSIKKGDHIILSYQLRRLDTPEPVATNELEAKAAANGEDILSPLIEQTATEVLTAAMGKGDGPGAATSP